MSQSPKPALHIPMAQVPLGQAATPLGGTAHAAPQAPQLLTWKMLISQPSLTLLLQLAHPFRQLPTPQTPKLHRAVALAGTGQALLQAEQFLASVAVFTSQPLAGFMSQSAKPWLARLQAALAGLAHRSAVWRQAHVAADPAVLDVGGQILLTAI